MATRVGIAALVFMMVQAVLFGIGIVVLLATPLKADAMTLMPVMVATTFALAVPLSWWLAPRLRASYWKNLNHAGPGDKLIDAIN